MKTVEFKNIAPMKRSSEEACRLACDIISHFWKEGGKLLDESCYGNTYGVGNYYILEDTEEVGEYVLLHKEEYEKYAGYGELGETVAFKGCPIGIRGHKEKILAGKTIDVLH